MSARAPGPITVFKHAIVRTPGASLVAGISSGALGRPSHVRALEQHAAYVRALQACGLEVTILPPAEDFPDSVFVEDAALCTPRGAIVTRPGADSRRGEAALMAPVLRRFYDRVEAIEAPGTLDAGDVMMVGSHYYIGASARTNEAGAQQLIALLQAWGMDASVVPLVEMLHLKTGVAYLEDGHLLVTGELAREPRFDDYRRTEVAPQEAYAANSIWVNGRVIMPAGHPRTRAQVAALGYPVIEVDTSEFRKLDGGVSCLSLRF